MTVSPTARPGGGGEAVGGDDMGRRGAGPAGAADELRCEGGQETPLRSPLHAEKRFVSEKRIVFLLNV